ncbi:MAG TPA: hypothetical protein VHM19_18705, partial [Polyangiales bacterium]|nr:hypothetical protein [Polyangiales bacterium]
MPNARSLLWLVCLPLSALAVRAAAQEEKTHVHATVLHIDGDDIVIDAGRAQLDAASELTVYRALEVRHPVTRKLLRDRFAIATLRVSQAGERMSVMRLSGQPTHPLQVGDEVEVAVATQSRAAVPEAAPVTGATPAAVAASASATPSPAQTPASDKAEKQLLAYWNATLSQPPALRARYYTAYLQRFPESAYRQYVLEEIKYLEDLDAKLKLRARIFAPTAEEGTRVEMLALDTAREGYAVELAALVHPDPHFRGVLLQVRALEDTQGFRKLPMQLDARGHARAIVPADVVRAPG